MINAIENLNNEKENHNLLSFFAYHALCAGQAIMSINSRLMELM